MENSIRLATKYAISDEVFWDEMEDWYMEGTCLVLRSPDCVSKVRLIKNLLGSRRTINRMLWLTHKSSSTNRLAKDLKSHKFESCLETEGYLGDIDRVIVKYDHIHRLIEKRDDGEEFMPCYDLIVIDDTEAFLDRFDDINLSPHCELYNFSEMSYNELMSVILEDNDDGFTHIMVIDTEIGKRTKELVKQYDDVVFIHNEVDSIKTLVVGITLSDFVSSIIADWEENNKVLLISMDNSGSCIENMLSSKSDIEPIPIEDFDEDDHPFGPYDAWSYHIVTHSPLKNPDTDISNFRFDKVYCVMSTKEDACSPQILSETLKKIRVNSGKVRCLNSLFPLMESNATTINEWGDACSELITKFPALYESIEEHGHKVTFRLATL